MAAGPAAVSPNTGGLLVTHDLDFDLNPGTDVGGRPALVYNSATVAVRPVAEINIVGDIPRAVTGARVWLDANDEDAPPVSVPLTGQPGEAGWTVRVPLAAVAATGAYYWKARVELTTADGGVIYQQVSGKAQVVVRDNPADPSPFGAGWGITGLDRLSEDGCHDLLWVTGAGESRFFDRPAWAGPSGDVTYVSPPEDAGVLRWDSAAGEYVYTAADQTVTKFNDAGRVVSAKDRHGLVRTYQYDDDHRVTQITAPDGGVTTFAYGGGTVSISLPGRTQPVVLNTANGVLNSIQDVDAGRTTRNFQYAGGRMTQDDWAPYQSTFSYHGDSGRVSSVSRGPTTLLVASAADAAAADGVVHGPPEAVFKEALPAAGGWRETTIRTDARGRVLHTKVGAGLTESRFKRNAAGDATEARDAHRRPTTYQYNSAHAVTAVTRPDGATESFGYGAFGQLSSHTDQLGRQTTYALNALGDVTRVTDALGHATDFVYASSAAGAAAAGLVTSMTAANGAVETYTYDGHRRRLTVQQPLVAGSTSGVTATAYDAAGNVMSVTDPLGRVTATAFDGRGQLTGTTDALGQTATYGYAASGLPTKVTEPALADGQKPETEYAYDARGLLTLTTEGSDIAVWRSASRDYDGLGRLVAETTGVGYGVLPARVTRTTYEYDALDRVVRTVTGDGAPNTPTTTTLAAYDPVGNLVSETAADGVTTAYYYDAADRRKRAEEAHQPGTKAGWAFNLYANRTCAEFDAAGNVVAETTGESNRPDAAAAFPTRTTYLYDSLNRVTLVTEGADTAAAVSTQTLYDDVGNVEAVTEAIPTGAGYGAAGDRSVTTVYEYDALNNPVAEYAAFTREEETITRRAYDQAGNVLFETTGLSERAPLTARPATTRYEYDDLNRPVRVTEAWDENDAAVSPEPGVLRVGRVTTTAYDSQDRPVAVTTGQSWAGVYAAPLTTATTYDVLGNVVRVTEAAGSGVERYTTFAVDTAGNVLAETAGQSAVPGYAKPRTTLYAYDSLGRLAAQVEAANTVEARKTVYGYDPAGRLAEKTEGLLQAPVGVGLQSADYAAPRVAHYGYNLLGRRTSTAAGYVNDQTHWRATATTYDAAGNTRSEWAGAFFGFFTAPRFDHSNRTDYEYDALGRVTRTVEAPNSSAQRATEREYDSAGNVRWVTRGLGDSVVPPAPHGGVVGDDAYSKPAATAFDYDRLGRKIFMAEDAGAWSYTVPMVWEWHNTTAMADTQRNTTWAYDAAGNVVRTVSGIGKTAAYDRSQVTVDAYDALGRLIARTEAAGTPAARRTEIEYDAADNVVGRTTGLSGDPANPYGYAQPVTTLTGFDALNRPTLLIEAAGGSAARQTTFTYDAADNEVSRTAGVSLHSSVPSNMVRTDTAYDALDRPVTVAEAVNTPAARYSTAAYDALDRVRSRTTGLTFNAAGKPMTTVFGYNAFGQVETQQEAVGVWAFAPAVGSLGVWVHDATAVNSVTRSAELRYDANGNLIQQTTGISPDTWWDYEHLGLTATVYDALNRPTKVVQGSHDVVSVNPGGVFRVTESLYDSADNVVMVTRYDGSRFEAVPGADAAKWSFSRTDHTRFEYDRLGRKTKAILGYATGSEQTDHLNQGTLNDWFPDGLGATSTHLFAYDAADNLVRAADPRGVVTAYAYDTLDRRTAAVFGAAVPAGVPLGAGWTPPVTRQVYDAQDRVVISVDPLNAATHQEYDDLGRLTTFEEGGTWGNGLFSLRPEGRVSVYAYDATDGLIYRKVGLGAETFTPPGTSAPRPYARPETTVFSYDALGRRVGMTRAAGGPDESANLGHLPPQTTWAYDAADNVTRADLPINSVVTVFDDLGRPTLVTEGANDPNAKRDTWTDYDSAGNVVGTTGGLGVFRKTVYDALNRPVSVVNGPAAASVTTTLQYNLFGLTSQSSAATGEEQFVYDRQGRLVWQRTNEAHWLLNRYDAAGNRVAFEDWVKPYYYTGTPTATQPIPPKNMGDWRKLRTVYQYDPLNRVISTESPTGRAVAAAYDAAGRVRSLTEWYETGEPGHLLSSYVPDTKRQREFAYDALGRQTTEQWVEWTADTGDVPVARQLYAYDAVGNLLVSFVAAGSAADPVTPDPETLRTRTYDALNRVRTLSTPAGNLTYEYTANSQVVLAAGPGGATSSEYDAAGRLRLRTITSPNQPTYSAEFKYKPSHIPNNTGKRDLVAEIIYRRSDKPYAPVSAELNYDGLAAETSREYKQTADVDGVLTTTSKLLLGAAYAPGTHLLTSESRAGALTYEHTRTFTYSGVQVKEESTTALAIPEARRTVTRDLDENGNAVYPSAEAAADVSSGNQATASGSFTNEYDTAGNVIRQGAAGEAGGQLWLYDYDFANRLTRAKKLVTGPTVLPAVTLDIQFKYDAEGNIVKRTAVTAEGAKDEYGLTIPPQTDPVVTRYLRDGGHVWADLTDGGQVLSRYVYGAAVDQLLARQDPGPAKTYIYATDRQNSVVGVLDGAGTWQKTILYQGAKAYARNYHLAAGFHDRFEYTGREAELLTHLQHNRARWLDTDGSRWMSEDPLGFAAGDTNLYRYVNGSYVNATDPSGLEAYKNASAFPWNANNGELREAEIRANAGHGTGGGAISVAGMANGLLLGIPEAVLDLTGYGPDSWSREARLQWRLGDGLGTVGSLFLGYGDLALPIQAARLARGVNLMRAYRTVATGRTVEKYADWSIEHSTSPYAINADAAEWARLGGMAMKAYGGGQLMGGPLGYLTGASRVARFTAPVVGGGLAVPAVAGAVRDLVRLGDVPTARRLAGMVELAAGLRGGTSRTGAGAFRAGQTAGRRAVAETRLGRAFDAGEHAAVQWGLRQAIHRGVAAVSDDWHVYASAWARAKGYKVCFAAGTKLLARGPWGQGWRAIEAITTDDLVASRDEHDPNGPVAWQPVEELFARTAPIVEVAIGGRVIRTTAEHPFYADGTGWTAAGDLAAGDRLLGKDGEWTAVDGVAASEAWEPVYNLRVADFHTYFVGCDEWGFSVWAHNAECVLTIEEGRHVLRDKATKAVLHTGDEVSALAFAARKGHQVIEPGPSIIPNRYMAAHPEADHFASGAVSPWQVKDGKFIAPDGTPIHMSKAWAGNEHGIDFVIGMDGALRIGNRHSHLAQLGGDATQALAAGTLRIKNGEIAHITNYSGHFNPTVAETLHFPQLFKQAGFDVSGAGMTVFVPKVTTGPAQFTGGVSRFMQVKIGGGS